MEKQTIRIRRVGSVTFGVVLIITGILFLVHLFLPTFDYVMIFRLWPVILILLGAEVLLGCRHKCYEILDEKGNIKEQQKTVYDVTAIMLTLVLTCFAMGMGIAALAIRYQL